MGVIVKFKKSLDYNVTFYTKLQTPIWIFQLVTGCCSLVKGKMTKLHEYGNVKTPLDGRLRLCLLREVPLVHLVTRWIKQWVHLWS